MSNSFTLLENASNSDPLEIAAKTKEVKQDKPKFVEEKKPQQRQKPVQSASSESQVEEGFQGTRSKGRGGRPQHHQAPKKGRQFDRHVSGTGTRKGEVKKGGGGKANWGKPTEEKEEKPVAEQSEAVGEATTTEEKKEESTTPVETKPVDTSLTLEEYLSQKKTAKVTLKKEAGEQLVTGKNVKLTDTALERSDASLFEKEKKKVEKEEKTTDKKTTEKKPKTLDVSEFLDAASLEKMKERRDKELLEGPKQRPPRTQGGSRQGQRGGVKKGPKTGGNNNKDKSAPKKQRPVINKEKDFPALSPQN